MIEEPLKEFQKRIGKKRFRFLQDKDTTQTSKSTRSWLDKNVRSWFLTASKSPDLNPIEMIWNTLEQRVYAQNPETQNELEEFIKKEWDGISQEIINNTIDKMIKTIPKIIEPQGNYVSTS